MAVAYLGQKIAEMRVELQKMDLQKSGENKFAGFNYFELGDFLPKINELAVKYKVFNSIRFYSDKATLTIVNNEDPTQIEIFECTTGAVTLKGCHDIQNVGAVQTYLRRYLYIDAYEIVEHDALDATVGKETKKTNQKNSNVETCNCSSCNIPIATNVAKFSIQKFGQALCMNCQKKQG